MTVLENLKVQGRTIPLTEHGYLGRFDDWSEAVAAALAQREGVGDLTPDKLDALRFIRWYYRNYNYFPIFRAVCKQVHQPSNCLEEGFINPLIAWKLAGLPAPEEPIISLLEAGQSPG
ncbi:MAG: TusE/DsrC/DsvC family sulfur relay protein [Nitrospiraceae bacterium]|nr:TusE/DsrC/DsvC family sulfur relay protein [Nitrospiraceae bacterium]